MGFVGSVASMLFWTAAPYVEAAAVVAAGVQTVKAARAPGKAAKAAEEQSQQAARVRAEESARLAETTKKATTLATEAETLKTRSKEAAITAGLRRGRRATIATGPKGLLGEPEVMKPTLLGA